MSDRSPHARPSVRGSRPTLPTLAPGPATSASRVHPPGGLALAALLLSACGGEADAVEPGLTGARLREPTQVLVEPVQRREMVRRLETTARVQSEREVVVHPRSSGVVVELLVEEGDRVEAGDVLARLDDRDARIARDEFQAAFEDAREDLPRLELALREAEARLATAERSAEQADRDHQRNVAISRGEEDRPGLLSAKELDASALAAANARGELETARLAREQAVLEQAAGERAVERARLALERSELALSYMSIEAPQAGLVTKRQVNVGDMISPGAFDVNVSRAAFAITDPEALEVVLYRPQRELPLFRAAVADGLLPDGDGAPGATGSGGEPTTLEVTARADGLPDRAFHGWIDRISPVVDPESGNFHVRARLEPGTDPHRLLTGMLVRVDIVTERRPDALVVPKKALAREGDRSLVWVVRDGRAHRIEVEEGLADDDAVEVFPAPGAGLAPGEPVVVVGKDLEDGDEVSYPEATPDRGAPDAAGGAGQDAGATEIEDA